MRDIFESFEFHTQIDKLAKSGLLYLVTEKFANIDLHPDAVSNADKRQLCWGYSGLMITTDPMLRYGV